MNKNNNIVLIGLMGSGKTTIGKLIAQKTSLKFFDTDEVIVLKAKKSIKQIFAEEGEIFFRHLESEVVEEVSGYSNIVISTGGGAVLRKENFDRLKKCGKTFYLYAPAEELFKRIKDDSERPLVNTASPLESLSIIQQRRNLIYSQAHFKIDTLGKNPEQVSEEIIALYNS